MPFPCAAALGDRARLAQMEYAKDNAAFGDVRRRDTLPVYTSALGPTASSSHRGGNGGGAKRPKATHRGRCMGARRRSNPLAKVKRAIRATGRGRSAYRSRSPSASGVGADPGRPCPTTAAAWPTDKRAPRPGRQSSSRLMTSAFAMSGARATFAGWPPAASCAGLFCCEAGSAGAATGATAGASAFFAKNLPMPLRASRGVA